ncbi:hypothetical protein A8711_04865 [Micromonospora sp. II]|nr:hypothetical protein A8711_04865 [Micromonospora sp. II]
MSKDLSDASGKSPTLNVTSTSAFARTAAASTCRSLGSLDMPSMSDSYPLTMASGNASDIWPIRRSTRSSAMPRAIRLRRSSSRTSLDQRGR